MKYRFDCFVGIDWSGNKKKWQNGLKIAYAAPGSSAPELVDGEGPDGRWSRTDAILWIKDLICRKRALIGLDFAFGFPKCGVSLDWEYIERLCGDEENFYGGKFFRASDAEHSHLVNSPWIARRGAFIGHLRETERAAGRTTGARPQSVFNAVGAAQVGPSSISGMRALLHLKRDCGDQMSIWPFDDFDCRRSVIVEVFPRYFPLTKGVSSKLADYAVLNEALSKFDSATVERAPRSEDEGDALLSAAALRSLSLNKGMFAFPDDASRNEGWIFGVPCEGVQ